MSCTHNQQTHSMPGTFWCFLFFSFMSYLYSTYSYILDTGVRGDHQDFRRSNGSSRVNTGPNFSTDSTPSNVDQNGHGYVIVVVFWFLPSTLCAWLVSSHMLQCGFICNRLFSFSFWLYNTSEKYLNRLNLDQSNSTHVASKLIILLQHIISFCCTNQCDIIICLCLVVGCHLL